MSGRNNMVNRFWLLAFLASLACTPIRQNEAGLVLLKRVQVPSALGDETYYVILGRDLSKLAERRATERTGGAGPEFIRAEQEESRLLVEEELHHRGICPSGVDVVRRLLHFDHSPHTEIVVRCLPAK